MKKKFFLLGRQILPVVIVFVLVFCMFAGAQAAPNFRGKAVVIVPKSLIMPVQVFQDTPHVEPPQLPGMLLLHRNHTCVMCFFQVSRRAFLAVPARTTLSIPSITGSK